jgi:DNA recombination protein RmuC
MLREFGLELGRDFIMQHTIEGQEDGSRLRPDAVVFLPGDTVLTVDSKASKYLLEAANAEGTEREQDAYTNLAKTMNAHLKALSSKDYASAIQATYRKAGRGDRVAYAINIMYLPTEGGIERLSRADAQFQKKAVAENIVIAGPTGLMSNIGFARCRIDLGRQADNQEKIILAARQLIEAVTTVVGYVAGVGKGIKAAADSHAKLVSSVNSRLLPRQRTLANLGVRQAKQKELPGNVPLIQVFSQEETDVIEGESEEVATLVEATKLTVVRD